MAIDALSHRPPGRDGRAQLEWQNTDLRDLARSPAPVVVSNPPPLFRPP